MLATTFFISPADLWAVIGTATAPQIVDVRRPETYEASASLLPTAMWRNAADRGAWANSLDCSRPIVVACAAGHERSQAAVADLRERGFQASVLTGGIAAWIEAGLPVVGRAAFQRLAPQQPSLWVTRRRPKIDRVACPWLIRRFIDAEARILFVDPPDVQAVARESGAVPFDIEGIELSHEGERCSFDTMLKIFGLDGEPSLARLALIVRGADTARTDLAPEAAGLLAVSLGLSALAKDDDRAMLGHGFIVYDALYAWLRFAAAERHNWPAKTTIGTAS
jgi:rhodanese-related sulfurtransferase